MSCVIGMLKTVVFDFDGVIVDSNHGKENAFYRLFEGNPKVPRPLVADVLARNMGTRFDILRDIFVLAGLPADRIPELVREEGSRFDMLVQDWILKRGLAPGAEEVLPDLAGRFCLYINSATPEDALHMTVKHLGIGTHFRGIHGAPPTKEENLAAILAREGITGQEVVVVGDGEGDLRSARSCGAFFIAIASGFHPWGKDADFPVASDIREAGALIGRLGKTS